MRMDVRPTGRGQHDDGDAAAFEILLIPEILIRRDEGIPARLLGRCQQRAIGQIAPSLR